MGLTVFAEWTVMLVEGAGVLAITVAAVGSTGQFIYRVARKRDIIESYHYYRETLGRGILLGLEFLVAGDIINTVVIDLTFNSLGILAIIVVIRTFLSFTLEVEVHGRWPWEHKVVHSARVVRPRAD